MADFLMIVPDGYVEVDGTHFQEVTGSEPRDLTRYLEEGAYWELFPAFEALGLIVDGQKVEDYKVFDTGTGVKVWAKIVEDI